MTRTARYLAAAAATLAAGFAVAQQPRTTRLRTIQPHARRRALARRQLRGLPRHQGRPAKGSDLAGLAGKPRSELLMALTQFKEGKKPATVMHQLAKGYSEQEIAALADYFSNQGR